MPPTPMKASAGAASASADSGAIKIPKRAMEGMVCRILRIANNEPRSRGLPTAMTPSGTPAKRAGRSEPSTRVQCRPISAPKMSRLF
jgi:hypothetical protein